MFLNGSKSGKNTLNPTRYVLVRRKVQLLNDVFSSQIMQNLDVTSVVMPEPALLMRPKYRVPT